MSDFVCSHKLEVIDVGLLNNLGSADQGLCDALSPFHAINNTYYDGQRQFGQIN